MSDRSIVQEIARLQRLSVGELRAEWVRLYGQETRSRNRVYLWRRLAWRLQELAYGGLSDAAKQRLAELASSPGTYTRTRLPREASAALASIPVVTRRHRPTTLSAGTILTRKYQGHDIVVRVLDGGFEWDGRTFGSLSEVARAVTGSHWNGKLFFKLTSRKRG